jgi:ABC-type amino acid transport substrate-binding protein
MRKTITVLLLCCAILAGGAFTSVAAAAEPSAPVVQAQLASIAFADVPAGSLYYDAIMDLAQRGILGGYESGLFGPSDALNRAQLAKVIVAAKGFHTPPIPTGASTFADVPNDGASYPFDRVEEAAANGLVGGYADGSFGPYDQVTRIQLTRVVVRAFPDLDSPPAGYVSGFADVAAEDEPFVATAKYNGLIEGKTASAFEPFGLATRGETAKMLYVAESLAGGGDRPLRLAYDQAFAPFAYKDEGGVARGWSIELVQAACDRIELEVVFIPTDMPSQANMFARGQIDAVMDKAVNAPRVLNEFEFSQHYVLTGAALLRPVGESSLDLSDAAGLKLATPGTGPVFPYLQGAVPTATLISTADYRSSLEAVLAGTADAAALNSDVGYDLAEKLFPGQFGRPGTMFMEVGLAIARPKDMGRDFLDSFDAGLAMIRSDGTLATILGDR